MNSKFEGVMTALATPFYDGAFDEPSFVRLLHHQLEAGINGFVVGGTTGESPTLSQPELHRIFDIARAEARGRALVIIGTGTNSTAATIEKTRAAESWGADAALLVVPYYNRPPQKGLIAHFREIARSTALPLILYNVPSRTSSTLAPDSVQALASEKNIVAIKDATGVMETLAALKSSSLALLSGDDATCVEFCRLGGHGVISVVSHLIPRQMISTIADTRAGRDIQFQQFQELLRWLYCESNPIPLKWALKEMGIFRSAELRLPLLEMDSANAEGFRACLRKLKLV